MPNELIHYALCSSWLNCEFDLWRGIVWLYRKCEYDHLCILFFSLIIPIQICLSISSLKLFCMYSVQSLDKRHKRRPSVCRHSFSHTHGGWLSESVRFFILRCYSFSFEFFMTQYTLLTTKCLMSVILHRSIKLFM